MSMANMAQKYWYEIAGTKHPARLLGFLGPLDGFIQFPRSPDEYAIIYSNEPELSIRVSLNLTATRHYEALARNEVPEFYYS
jgi:hypothetical protein